jgi:hypothetical protein
MGWHDAPENKLAKLIGKAVGLIREKGLTLDKDMDDIDSLLIDNYDMDFPEEEDELEAFTQDEGSPFRRYREAIISELSGDDEGDDGDGTMSWDPDKMSWDSEDTNGDGDKDMAVVDLNGDGKDDVVASTADTEEEDDAASSEAAELSEKNDLSSTGKTKGELKATELPSDERCKKKQQQQQQQQQQQKQQSPVVAWWKRDRVDDMRKGWGETSAQKKKKNGTLSDESQKNIISALSEHRL